jgi:SAM-dependent methyltransferase
MTSTNPQSAQEVKQFWDTRAGKGEDRDVTHPDVWQRWLEIEMIKRFLAPRQRVLDIGCGNGFTTRAIAPLVDEVIGVDYSEEMIRRARSTPSDAKFATCNVLNLESADFGAFDVVITERCLINLASWEEQQQALRNIASVIAPGGRLLFIEGSADGRERLNALRGVVGLDTMPTVWHNIDFKSSELLRFFKEETDLEVEHALHFGTYDFIARIVHPLLVAPDAPQYDTRINQIAAKLALDTQEHSDISRVLFWVLAKK